MTVLIAGVGNIFLKDDAFGPKVIEELQKHAIPEVDLVDFGIRGWDLMQALLGEYQLKIIVDVCRRGLTPGSLYVIEPELNLSGHRTAEWNPLSSHSIDLVNVFALMEKMGGSLAGVRLVACEPMSFEFTEDDYDLSGPVQAAVNKAVECIIQMIPRAGCGADHA